MAGLSLTQSRASTQRDWYTSESASGLRFDWAQRLSSSWNFNPLYVRLELPSVIVLFRNTFIYDQRQTDWRNAQTRDNASQKVRSLRALHGVQGSPLFRRFSRLCNIPSSKFSVDYVEHFWREEILLVPRYPSTDTVEGNDRGSSHTADSRAQMLTYV